MNAPQRAASTNHAQVYGSPGERPRLAGLLRALWPMLVVAGVAGGLCAAMLPVPRLSITTGGFLLLLLAAAVAVAVVTSRRRVGSFIKGARGEEDVARELSFLPASYSVFHGLSRSARTIMGRGGDVDHMVIGPTGVFVIETKNWDGAITVDDAGILYDGKRPDRPPLQQVKAAAAALHDVLREASEARVACQPVVCFAADTVAGDSREADGVRVCNVRVLNRLITTAERQSLAPETCARLQAHLRGMMDR